MNCVCPFGHFLLTIIELQFVGVTDLFGGAAGIEEVTHLIDSYFAEGSAGVSSDQSIRRHVLTETQS